MRSMLKPNVVSRKWAEALRDREASGERLTPPQKAAWRTALGTIGSQPTYTEEAP
jgi:hypothetical protein